MSNKALIKAIAEKKGKKIGLSAIRKIEELLMRINDVPEEIRQTVINNGGGHYNHSLFWELL